LAVLRAGRRGRRLRVLVRLGPLVLAPPELVLPGPVAGPVVLAAPERRAAGRGPVVLAPPEAVLPGPVAGPVVLAAAEREAAGRVPTGPAAVANCLDCKGLRLEGTANDSRFAEEADSKRRRDGGTDHAAQCSDWHLDE